jgi:hypothetical protein
MPATFRPPHRFRGCGKGARVVPPTAAGPARPKPQMRLITQQVAPPIIVPIKAAAFVRNIHPESWPRPQLWRWLKR